MSRLYWMSSIIASTSGADLSFSPTTLSGLHSTNVSAAVNEAATNKTGVIMSKTLTAGTTSFSFSSSYFNDNMYVGYYSTADVRLKGVPTYSSGTLTFTCDAVQTGCTFRIVVQF